MKNARCDESEEYRLMVETFMQICLYLNSFFLPAILIWFTSRRKSEGTHIVSWIIHTEELSHTLVDFVQLHSFLRKFLPSAARRKRAHRLCELVLFTQNCRKCRAFLKSHNDKIIYNRCTYRITLQMRQ